MQIIEDDGVEESQEDAVEVDPDDSVDGGVLVNGNDGEEHWGMNNKELHLHENSSCGSIQSNSLSFLS
jgi:hypothetical protein